MKSLEELLAEGECENIEFKKSASKLSKDIWETYSAFANTNGGYIVLGVTEQQSRNYEITGVSNFEKLVEELFNTAANKDKVNRNILTNDNVKTFKKDGKDVVIIYVPELSAKQKPLYLNKNMSLVYIRKNTGDYLATEEEIRRFIRNASDNEDGELLNGYTIDDLDKDSILLFKNIVNSRKPDKQFLQMTDMEFLQDIGVFKIDRDDNRKWKLTLAGLLLLGTDEAITSRIPHFHLDYLNKKGNNERWIDRVSTGDLRYPNLNVLKFYDIVLKKLLATIEEPFQLEDRVVRKSFSELEIMFREALVNMLIHADYLDSETSIRAEAHDLFYTFYNPGTMKIPQDQFFVGNQSEPRNSTLMTFFKKIGAAEREGGGGKEIFAVSKKNKFRVPELEVTLKNTFLKLWIAVPEESYSELSEDVRKVFFYIKNSDKLVSMKELEDNIHITNYKARKYIKELADRDLVEIHGQGKATKYYCKMSKIERIALVDELKKQISKG